MVYNKLDLEVEEHERCVRVNLSYPLHDVWIFE